MFFKAVWRVALYATRLMIASALAFLAWGVSLYYAPGYVISVGRFADRTERALVDALETVAPQLAAIVISIPITPNVMFLSFFLPCLLVVILMGSLFGRND